jgi:hypothetical protein
LREALAAASFSLRSPTLRAILGLKRAGLMFETRAGSYDVTVMGRDAWVLRPSRDPAQGRRGTAARQSGRGFIRLAGALFGVDPGTAAVRFLEAVTLDRLDTRAALEMAAVINAWVGRGAPEREGRS